MRAVPGCKRKIEGFALNVLGIGLHYGGTLFHTLFHHFARFEFNGGAGRNYKVAARLVGVAAYTRLRKPHLENTKIPEFDIVALGERLDDVVEGALDDVKDLMLHEPGLITDVYNNFAFREGSHSLRILSVRKNDMASPL